MGSPFPLARRKTSVAVATAQRLLLPPTKSGDTTSSGDNERGRGRDSELATGPSPSHRAWASLPFPEHPAGSRARVTVSTFRPGEGVSPALQSGSGLANSSPRCVPTSNSGRASSAQAPSASFPFRPGHTRASRTLLPLSVLFTSEMLPSALGLIPIHCQTIQVRCQAGVIQGSPARGGISRVGLGEAKYKQCLPRISQCSQHLQRMLIPLC